MRRYLISLALGAATIFGQTSQANAQAQPPSYYSMSELGVDLKSGAYMTSSTDLSIGQPGNGLTFSRSYTSGMAHAGPMGKGWIHNQEILGIKTGSGTSAKFSFNIGSSVRSFSGSTGSWVSESGDGTILDGATTGNPTLTYYAKDGTKIVFSYNSTSGRKCWAGGTQDCRYEATQLVKPNGEQLNFRYTNLSGGLRRLMSVNSTLSWNLSFGYHSASSSRRLAWVQATNTAEEYCPNTYGSQPYCSSQSGGWKRVSFTYTSSNTGQLQSVKDNNNDTVVTYGYDSQDCLTTIQKSSSPSADLTNTYTSGKVTSQLLRSTYTDDGGSASTTLNGTWTYTYWSSQSADNVDILDPAGDLLKTAFRIGEPKDGPWVVQRFTQDTEFDYDNYGRVTRKTLDEGNYTQYTYDNRGNVTEVRRVAKSGSGLADIVTKAGGYVSSCTTANAKTCNKPAWTEDALGNRTDYYYGTNPNVHGQPQYITLPAQTSGVRPRIYYDRNAEYAKRKTSGGGFINQPVIYLLEYQHQCRTLASCAWNSSDAETQRIDYASSKNLLPVSVQIDPNGLNLTTSTTYDQYGNVKTVDGAYTGTADTTRYYYDNLNRFSMVIGPDPDGSGSLQRPATYINYGTDRLPSYQYEGRASSQPNNLDLGAAGFYSRLMTTYHRDSLGRVISSRLRDHNGSGYVFAAMQTKFNADGTLDCTQMRMNSAVIQGAISGYCSASAEGDFGPDRITQTHYDNRKLVKKITNGVGTALQQDTVDTGYTGNGLPSFIRDARLALTIIEYDGHDRIKKVRYPRPSGYTNPGCTWPNCSPVASSTDYEEFTYDANGQVLTHRRRDGSTVTYTYDNLGRVLIENRPQASPNIDVYYTYDNLGRVLKAAHASYTSSWSITYTYDKAGRLLTENSYGRTMSYAYFENGKRTRLTWPDGFYVDYQRDTLGRVIEIRENGATSGAGLLAKFTYDSYGRRTRVDRGNNADTTYSYDVLNRLTSMTNDFSGTSYDNTETFTYSPASQIVDHSYSNDSVYRWYPGANDIENNSFDFQNKITSADGQSTTHNDNRGNLTGAGSDSFAYDDMNRLTSATVGGNTTTLSYDPVGRLRHLSATGETTVYPLYSGSNLVAEYTTSDSSSSTLTNRYVPGPGVDEPLVWYTDGTTGSRQHLHANAQGSIVGVSHGTSAANVQHFKYDPYGTPSDTGGSRFKYTGQLYLHKAGLYHYKARAYSPKLGRFLQTDPIGYGDGMNMYAYVGGDPINKTDPLGLCGRSIPTGEAQPSETLVVVGCPTRTFFNGAWGSGFFEIVLEPGLGNAEYLFSNIRQRIADLQEQLKDADFSELKEWLAEDLDEIFENACLAGNSIASLSSDLADISVGTTIAGGVTLGVGAATGQPEIIGAGNALMSVGGIVGLGAGGLQFTAGLFQYPGSGDLSNSINAAGSFFTGAALGRLSKFSFRGEYSGPTGNPISKPGSRAEIAGNITGAGVDGAGFFSGPKQVSCN